MPEITEIRKYADFIKKHINGKKILNINILNGRYKKHKPFEKYDVIMKNLPLKLIDIATKGKLMYFIMEKNIFIKTTMGLSGGWCFVKNKTKKILFSDVMGDYIEHSNGIYNEKINQYMENAIKHRNIEFVTENGSLFFYDMLSFGTIKVIDDKQNMEKELKKLGPDIMNNETTFNEFTKRIFMKKNMEKEIGIVLMDQKTISGIGNYLRSDILYMSKINPFRTVKKLTNIELQSIYNNAKILTWGDYDINKGKQYGIIKKTTKLPSDYDRMFFVYGQETDIYGNKVIYKTLYEGSQKRYIYYVPSIQK